LRGFCKLGSLCNFLHRPPKIRYVEKKAEPALPLPEVPPQQVNFFAGLSEVVEREAQPSWKELGGWRLERLPSITEKKEINRRAIRRMELEEIFRDRR
jgi:hypothetical protein